MTLINLHLGLFSKLVDISILVFHLLIRSFSYAVAHSYGGIAVVLKSAKLDVGVPNVWIWLMMDVWLHVLWVGVNCEDWIVSVDLLRIILDFIEDRGWRSLRSKGFSSYLAVWIQVWILVSNGLCLHVWTGLRRELGWRWRISAQCVRNRVAMHAVDHFLDDWAMEFLRLIQILVSRRRVSFFAYLVRNRVWIGVFVLWRALCVIIQWNSARSQHNCGLFQWLLDVVVLVFNDVLLDFLNPSRIVWVWVHLLEFWSLAVDMIAGWLHLSVSRWWVSHRILAQNWLRVDTGQRVDIRWGGAWATVHLVRPHEELWMRSDVWIGLRDYLANGVGWTGQESVYDGFLI